MFVDWSVGRQGGEQSYFLDQGTWQHVGFKLERATKTLNYNYSEPLKHALNNNQ